MARYGNIKTPFKENDILNPVDPYGVAKVAAENIGSQRVLEKCGFKVNKKCRVEKSGKMIDAFFYIKTNA